MADLEARPLRGHLRELPPRPLQRALWHAGDHRAQHGRQSHQQPFSADAYGRAFRGQDPCRRQVQLPSLRGTSHHLGAFSPGVCYRCHGDMQDLQRIAGPHQICGPNGFNCTTCHDPHGQIKEATRQGLVPWLPQGRAHHGLAFVDSRAQRRGLHGLPRSASPQQRAAVREHQPLPGGPSQAAPHVGAATGGVLQVPSEDLCPERTCRRITRSRKARWSARIATIRTGNWSGT